MITFFLAFALAINVSISASKYGGKPWSQFFSIFFGYIIVSAIFQVIVYMIFKSGQFDTETTIYIILKELGGIFALGILIFYFLSLRKEWKLDEKKSENESILDA